jgi:hypothetical protein
MKLLYFSVECYFSQGDFFVAFFPPLFCWWQWYYIQAVAHFPEKFEHLLKLLQLKETFQKLPPPSPSTKFFNLSYFQYT